MWAHERDQIEDSEKRVLRKLWTQTLAQPFGGLFTNSGTWIRGHLPPLLTQSWWQRDFELSLALRKTKFTFTSCPMMPWHLTVSTPQLAWLLSNQPRKHWCILQSYCPSPREPKGWQPCLHFAFCLRLLFPSSWCGDTYRTSRALHGPLPN